MTVHDELEAVLAAGRWEDLRPYVLADPGSEVHRSASDWYRSRHAHWYDAYWWQSSFRKDPAVDGQAALRILALAFLPPAGAARELGRLTYGWASGASDELVVETALARGSTFCRPFLDAASRLTFSKEAESSVGWVARLGVPLVDAGVAELPDGPAFGRGWARMFSWSDPDEPLVRARDDASVREEFEIALATPEAFAPEETFRRPGHELELSVARLVDEGVLDRGRIIRGVLEALTRPDSAHSQRALARILQALELGREDAVDRLPLLLHLLATARGPVTAVLLPAVIAAAGDEDIPPVATTVFTRPEKAQRTTLLRALVAKDAPWGREARVQALQVAADLPDRALAERAGRALAALDAEPAPPPGDDASPLDLWIDPLPVGPPRPVTVVDPDEASMRAALSRLTVEMDPSDGAMFWDAAVRWAHADARAAVAWARGLGDRVYEADVPAGLTPLRAEPWDRVGPAEHRRLRESTERFHTGVRAPYDADSYGVTSRSTTQALHKLLMSETTRRLAEIPLVVSTPTRTDGTLELSALVERLRGYAAGRDLVGPVDLFVALLRLEPVDPARAAELDGVEVGLWSEEETGGMPRPFRRRRHADAVQLVRDWIRGGGLPPLEVTHRGGAVDLAPSTLPVPAEAFGGIPPSLLAGHEDGVHEEYSDWSVGVETDAGVVPGWADLLAARLQRSFNQTGRFPPMMLPHMAASPRPGRAVVHAVTATLSHADEDRRLVAVDAALTIMGRGLWDPAAHTTCCLHLLADGQLRLGRLAHSWEQLILAGGLTALWPTATAVLDGACALAKKPPGLAELLAMLRRYVTAVPDVVVPESVVELAASKGSSKARVEAAAFVEAASTSSGVAAGASPRASAEVAS